MENVSQTTETYDDLDVVIDLTDPPELPWLFGTPAPAAPNAHDGRLIALLLVAAVLPLILLLLVAGQLS